MTLFEESVSLLKKLISTPSLSREEGGTAETLVHFFQEKKIGTKRSGHNVWAVNRHFSASKPTFLLNSHHDTVKPAKGYTRDPFVPTLEAGKLYGLGSNDAGGCLVSLIAAFVHFYPRENLPFNLLMACSAEEEISGKNGIAALLPELPAIESGIVGEPTQMQMAVAEKGLMVLDCTAHGKSGHAARNEGENAIYKAMADIEWFKNFQFEKESEELGPVKMSVTVIEAGKQHNVVPDRCNFTVDVRTTDAYSNEATLAIIRQHVRSDVKARSTRLNPSGIEKTHAFMQVGQQLGKQFYGSPTLSDQALMSFPTIKMGPGDSARSHTADEFIFLEEIEKGIAGYIEFVERLVSLHG